MRRRCLDVLQQMAAVDQRLVYIGSDPGAGTMAGMEAVAPGRCLIEGIAEGHLIGMAAGLALDGFVPYVNTIATFLTRRCFEQVAVDLCLHNLPVRLIANGGGVVYAPLGPTHEAIEDIAILRALPRMAVVCPADAEEMEQVMRQSADWPGPLYIRIAKGGDPVITRADEDPLVIGKARLKRAGADVLLVGTGIMTGRALAAADQLADQGISAAVLHMPTVKPLDQDTLLALSAEKKLVVTVEEHVRTGGLGSAVLESLNDARCIKPVLRLALPDAFPVGYGSQDNQLAAHGLDVAGIVASITAALA